MKSIYNQEGKHFKINFSIDCRPRWFNVDNELFFLLRWGENLCINLILCVSPPVKTVGKVAHEFKLRFELLQFLLAKCLYLCTCHSIVYWITSVSPIYFYILYYISNFNRIWTFLIGNFISIASAYFVCFVLFQFLMCEYCFLLHYKLY